jgi:peptidoglycan-N-acetylmuramic acid deacetylase
MKSPQKILLFILAVLLFNFITTTGSFAVNNNFSWYIKRNGNNRPIIQKEQKMIYNYDGYFLDKKVSDDDERKVIYLTFDVGYENGNTSKIMDSLKKESVPAAFFVLDNVILKNTDLVMRMIDEGHLVCNHTKNHKNLCNATDEEIVKNITALEKIYEEKTDCQLAKYFRFPEGKYSENALRCVQKLGYKTIFWSFAYDDWDNNRQSGEKKAIKKILENTHNGAVMLFHPTSDTNAKIFPTLIKAWKDMGYTFGTLDELVK